MALLAGSGRCRAPLTTSGRRMAPLAIVFTAEAAEAGGLAGAQSNADGSTGAHG